MTLETIEVHECNRKSVPLELNYSLIFCSRYFLIFSNRSTIVTFSCSHNFDSSIEPTTYMREKDLSKSKLKIIVPFERINRVNHINHRKIQNRWQKIDTRIKKGNTRDFMWENSELVLFRPELEKLIANTSCHNWRCTEPSFISSGQRSVKIESSLDLGNFAFIRVIYIIFHVYNISRMDS